MKHRVVSVSDEKNAQRVHRLLHEALSTAHIDMDGDRRYALTQAFITAARDEGLTLTWQTEHD